MVDVRFERVIALPSPTLPNTLYFVKPSDAQAVFLYATDVNGRALPIEQGQALSNAMLIERLSNVEYKLDLLLAGGGGATPNLTNTPIESPAPVTSVAGAPAAFDNLQSTADDQDARLAQLEAA